MIDVVTKGYYEVWGRGVKISQHTNPYKASIRSIEEKIKDPTADVYVKQPMLEAVAEQNDNFPIHVNIEIED